MTLEFPDKESIAYSKCKSEWHYLNAVIHEGLRVVSVVCGDPPRLVPKGGKITDDHYISEEVSVRVAINVLQNLSLHWKDPAHSNPEHG